MFLKKITDKFKAKRKIKRLDFALHKISNNLSVSNLTVLREVLTDNWVFYYSISGFLDGQYFQIYTENHKVTGSKEFYFGATNETDPVRTKILFSLFKKYGKIELEQYNNRY